MDLAVENEIVSAQEIRQEAPANEIEIITRHCCGNWCATAVINGVTYKTFANDDNLHTVFCQARYESHIETIADWQGRLQALKNLLATLGYLGILTEMQVEVETEKWVENNPYPVCGHREAVDAVTVDFEDIKRRAPYVIVGSN